jgi:voltage-gated potassium channel
MGIAKGTRRPSLEWGMFFLAMLMIPLILIQVSSEDQDVLFATEIANAVIWVIFVAELVYARRRSTTGWAAFARTHALDLLIVALSPPFIVPAELGSLRVLRLLRLVRLLAVVGRIQQGTGRMTGRQGILYVGALVLFCIFIGGVSIHEIEPDHATTVWEGMWWAVVTVTTVGYGDISPVTFEGRLVAAALMFVGLGAFGALAGSISALFLVQREGSADRLERIERMLEELTKTKKTD